MSHRSCATKLRPVKSSSAHEFGEPSRTVAVEAVGESALKRIRQPMATFIVIGAVASNGLN
jgi:hypothetical protein